MAIDTLNGLIQSFRNAYELPMWYSLVEKDDPMKLYVFENQRYRKICMFTDLYQLDLFMNEKGLNEDTCIKTLIEPIYFMKQVNDLTMNGIMGVEFHGAEGSEIFHLAVSDLKQLQDILISKTPLEEFFELQTKEKNDEFLKKLGIKTCATLPPFYFQSARTKEEIAYRTLCLYAVYQLSAGAPVPEIRQWVFNNQLQTYLSPDEVFALIRKRLFIEEDQEKIILSWLIEDVYVGLWALGMIEELNPYAFVEVDKLQKYLPKVWEGENTDRFFALIKERNAKEMYRVFDFYYRLHWASVEERIQKNSEYIEDLYTNDEKTISGSVVFERRKMLTWIMNPNQNWDDVDIST